MIGYCQRHQPREPRDTDGTTRLVFDAVAPGTYRCLGCGATTGDPFGHDCDDLGSAP